MKKTIAVVALDPRAAAFYAGQIESLFHDYAEVRSYSVRDGSATGKLPGADLFAISTDAYGSAEEVAGEIDQEVRAIIDAAYARCQDILTARRAQLEQVAQYLLEHETMEAADFQAAFGEEPDGQGPEALPENRPAET